MSLAYMKSGIVRLAQFHLPSNTHLPPHRHISVWNTILKSHLRYENPKQAFLHFRQMLQANVKPNDLTFSLLIKACTLLSNSCNIAQEATQIHSHLIKCRFDSFVYVGTALVDFYAKAGCVSHAEQAFEDMPHRDLIAWNSLLSGYSYNGYDLDAFGVLTEMLRQGFSPCPVTMVSAVPSCARMGFFVQGKSVHAFAIKNALDLDPRVENALTAMYAKFSDVDAARLLFEGMSETERSVVSWNTMIGAYGKNGHFGEALFVFKRMREENIGANYVTVMSLLSANAPLDSTHCFAIKIGLSADASVNTSLVCMYARSARTELAQVLYESMPCKNLVSATAIISCYAEKGDMSSALKCFAQIQLENMKPDAITIIGILHGCTSFTYSRVGTALHGYSVKSGLNSGALVTNGLISMYGDLNDVDAAASLFLDLDERPLISWNSMISIYIQAGMLNGAMNLFCQMKVSGCSPDTITIASMLSGCSQLSSLQSGKSLHSFILRNSVEVDDFVGTALVDMYAKCGSIEYADKVFKSIKEPCLASWNTVISGYGMYGLIHEAFSHYSDMIQSSGIKPDEITFLGLLSACSHAGLVNDGREYFRIMTEDFGMVPGAQHCACMIDLFSRAGLLADAFAFIKNRNDEPDSVMWLALLSACYMHKEVKLGEYVAKKLFLLDQHNGGFYVLISNLYASTGRWNDVARVRRMMRDIGEDGCSGTSFIEATSPHFFQETHHHPIKLTQLEIVSFSFTVICDLL